MVNRNGPHFYWQENLNLKAITVYLCTAIIAGSVYFITGQIRKLIAEKKHTLHDKIWPILSGMVLMILVLLLVL